MSHVLVEVRMLDPRTHPDSNLAVAHAHDSESASDHAAVLDELLTVDDVAAILRVSKSWVYEQTRRRTGRADQLPHLKIGKYVRFEARAVRAFIRRRSRGA